MTGQNGFLARQCTTYKNITRTDESSRNRGMVAKIFPAPAEVPDPAVGNDEKEKGTQARSQASLMEAARVQEPTFRKSQSSLRLIAAARFIDVRASTNELRSLLEKPAFENDALFNCAGFASPR